MATAFSEIAGDHSIERRHEELLRRYAAELRLGDVLVSGGGVAALVNTAAELSGLMTWLIDVQGRIVAHSAGDQPAEIRAPDLGQLLTSMGPLDAERPMAVLIPPYPERGLTRRHVVRAVTRGETVFARLVFAEFPSRFTAFHGALADSVARHLAIHYAMQSRVARVSWNAKATLARQMIRESVNGDDLHVSADYLGIDTTADRVVVYLTGLHEIDSPQELERFCDELGQSLGVEALGTRGAEGIMLLIEASRDFSAVVIVGQIKQALSRALATRGESSAIVGVSAVARHDALERAYREAREVAICAERIGQGAPRVIAVDDMGPARLFIANSSLDSVKRYVKDILGPLLEPKPAFEDLMRTLQSFFDNGRRVRESAGQLGIHENTVRLRLAKVHDLTGLDVAADSNDQLSVQIALLALRLQGHPAVAPSMGNPTA